MKIKYFTIIIIAFFSSVLISQTEAQQNILVDLINNSDKLSSIAKSSDYQVQVIYTQIDRDAHNKPHFHSHHLQVDSSLYFYPASTVKMPASFLALQRLHELNIDPYTPLRIGADRFPQTAVQTDTSSSTGWPSVAHYIRKIFLVSDNDAFNRLYEFLGQEYIHVALKKMGYHDTRIKHRLAAGFDQLENEYVNPFWFYDNDQSIQYHREGCRSTFADGPLEKRHLIRGKGYYSDSRQKVIPEPFDFSSKNFSSLQDLHDMLQRIVFPENFEVHERFDISSEDYNFLLECMSVLPKNSKDPLYEEADNHVKFIMYGDKSSEFKIPEHIKIYNKVGFAYGFTTDVAYIIDTKHNIEFILAVQIHTNANEIYNDGKYEYEKIAFPFMGELGRAIYNHELNRSRTHLPDLSKYHRK